MVFWRRPGGQRSNLEVILGGQRASKIQDDRAGFGGQPLPAPGRTIWPTPKLDIGLVAFKFKPVKPVVVEREARNALALARPLVRGAGCARRARSSRTSQRYHDRAAAARTRARAITDEREASQPHSYIGCGRSASHDRSSPMAAATICDGARAMYDALPAEVRPSESRFLDARGIVGDPPHVQRNALRRYAAMDKTWAGFNKDWGYMGCVKAARCAQKSEEYL